MGTCYYLIRTDNRTGYDLGKAWDWHQVFGDDQCPAIWSDAGYLESRLREVWAGVDVPPDYFQKVAVDIIDWSEGKPFSFHSEHSGLVEELDMEGWENNEHRDWITGSRHSNDREELAEKRKVRRLSPQ